MAYDKANDRGALWKRKGDRGPLYTGTLNGERVAVWENDKRGNEKAPDLRIVKDTPKPSAQGDGDDGPGF
jgi:hypothetical protein